MTSDRSLNFTNKDLRNRSFKGLNLKGADFSKSDLRGCDFSGALLVGANFEGVRTGITFRQIISLAIVVAIATFLTAFAVIRTVFSALGEPFGGSNWAYIVALLVSLTISGTGTGIAIAIASPFNRIAFTLSATASGALLGFVYAGLAANKNPQAAIAGAILGGVLMGFTTLRFRTGIVGVIVAIAGAITSYGLTFWLWAVALAFLTGQKLVWGIFFAILSIAYLGLAINSLFLALKEMKKSAGTSFRKADLTDAVFENAQLKNTDFSEAIGVENK